MTYVVKPKFHHPELPKNALGYTHRDYEGKISTLCAGCGHDSITASIIEACFELSIEPHRVAKISGIGCSSKRAGICSIACGSALSRSTPRSRASSPTMILCTWSSRTATDSCAR